MKLNHNCWRRVLAAAPLLSVIAASQAARGEEIGFLAQGANRFSVSGRFMFNVSADFKHLASVADPGPGVGVHQANHLYDNGYVNVDDSGNLGNQTWNWSVRDQSSIDRNAQTLTLQSLRSPADGLTQKESDDPQYGFEAGYGRVLKSFMVGGAPLRLGLQGAFGMTLLDIAKNSTISGATTGFNDTYDLSGLPIIPNAPYIGAPPVPGGPVPLLLPDAPTTRAPINTAASVSERLSVGGNLYGFKVGPFLEYPVAKWLSLGLQGGFAAALLDGDFKWRESINGGAASYGREDRSEWLYGGFIEGQATVPLGKGWGVFAGVGWQSLGDYSVRAGSKAATINLGSAVTTMAGIRYSF